MSNRIVTRPRVPHHSTVEFWVEPKDDDSVDTYVAAVTMIDSQNNIIYLNKDITDKTANDPLVSAPLKSGEVYSASIKVVFASPTAKAVTNHRIRKPDLSVYGDLYPHEVPEDNVEIADGQKVGRQTVIIVMSQN